MGSELLQELDRAFRSNNLASQTEAIWNTKTLLKKHAKNEIVVNATLLKLADYFRTRYQIVMHTCVVDTLLLQWELPSSLYL